MSPSHPDRKQFRVAITLLFTISCGNVAIASRSEAVSSFLTTGFVFADLKVAIASRSEAVSRIVSEEAILLHLIVAIASRSEAVSSFLTVLHASGESRHRIPIGSSFETALWRPFLSRGREDVWEYYEAKRGKYFFSGLKKSIFEPCF